MGIAGDVVLGPLSEQCTFAIGRELILGVRALPESRIAVFVDGRAADLIGPAATGDDVPTGITGVDPVGPSPAVEPIAAAAADERIFAARACKHVVTASPVNEVVRRV